MAGYVQDAIILLGDSLTEGGTMPYGFCQQLIDAYNRKLDVLVRGLSGYNTTWVIPVFKQMLAPRTERTNRPKVQLLTIWFGANDSVFPGEPQHVPLAQFAVNLRTLVRLVRDPASAYYAPETRVVLLTPPPINTHQLIHALPHRDPPKYELDRDSELTRRYAEAVVQVGREERVPVVDTWTMLYDAVGQKEENMAKYLVDGIHLNTEAHKLVYAALVKTIKDEYPEIHYDNLEMVYPRWQIINNDNYMELLKTSSVRK